MDRDEILALAASFLKDGQIGPAKELLLRLLRDDLMDAEAHYTLGLCLMRGKDFVAAQQALQHAMLSAGRAGKPELRRQAMDAITEINRAMTQKRDAAVDRLMEEVDLFDFADAESADKVDELDGRWKVNFALYPYLGFIQRKAIYAGYEENKLNSYGFRYKERAVEYPYNGETDDAFIVGIFGGSVADMLRTDAWDILRERIAAMPAARGREVCVLQFAQGAFRQPQQVMTLAYFLGLGQRFDLVVNIDGFNEATSMVTNLTFGELPSMPVFTMVQSFRSLIRTRVFDEASLGRYHKMAKIRNKLARLGGRGDPVSAWRRKRLERDYAAIAGELLQTPDLGEDDLLVTAKGPRTTLAQLQSEPTRRDAVLGDMARYWGRNSKLLADLCAGCGAAYLHVLQPNQYVWNKTMTVEERDRHYDPDRNGSIIARMVFPYFRAEGQALAARGVPFFDGTGVFDDVTETVLFDADCHFTPTGNRIMAEKLLPEIARVLDGRA